jgi:hypothetical protein
MTGSVLTQRALRAAAHVGREAGVRFDEPVVLHDSSNLLLHLAPSPVVARVATSTAIVRHGDAWLAREVSVAGHVARKGAPVVAPTPEMDPGPHHFAGLTMTFWEHVVQIDDPIDPRRAGEALRDVHEALRDYPGELPTMAVMREAEEIIERLTADGTVSSADGDLLRGTARDVRTRVAALDLPFQAIHGDSHLGNAINTAEGPLWGDWEDTCRGPTQWDLGCLRASGTALDGDPAKCEAAIAAYGTEPADALVEARRLQGTVWSLVFAKDHPDIAEKAQERLAYYRELAP